MRASASPVVERVWGARSDRGGAFRSIAAPNVEIVVTYGARVTVDLRGPESMASNASCPPETAWIGIRLAVGASFSTAPSALIRDGRDASLHVVDDAFVALPGATTLLALPHFHDAEAFVHGLMRAGIIRLDAWVAAVATGVRHEAVGASLRTLQRRFARVTGISKRTCHQIVRARFAANLLRRGLDIADVVHLAGFVDQAHLGRAFSRYVGATPATVRRADVTLSLLYETDARPAGQTAS